MLGNCFATELICEWFFFFFLILQHITNPRKAKGHQDLVVNNPLSQDEGVSVCVCVCALISLFF